jgi:hypothetical protein
MITGTYLFDPDLARCFDEAFENAGVAPAAIGLDHIQSALRSCEFMLNSEWSTYGIRQWMVTKGTFTTTAGDLDVALPAGTIDVFWASLRRNGAETPMYPISRSDYESIATKDARGRPNQYFVDKQYNGCTMFLYNAPENSSDVVSYSIFKQMADVGGLSNTLHMPTVAKDCFVYGLAMRLAWKFNKAAYGELKNMYGGQGYPDRIGGKLFHMRAETGERADTKMTIARRR